LGGSAGSEGSGEFRESGEAEGSVESAGSAGLTTGPAAGPGEPARAATGALPPSVAPAARRLFGDRLPLAERYAAFLADQGVVRGLLGPREPSRVWDRHLLNCAVVAELIPSRAFVIDIGSGAGLPGIVLAIARPDLRLVLIEPQQRRTTFLNEAVEMLGLTGRVAVRRARAEEFISVGEAAATRAPDGKSLRLGDVVTARALAPLDRLAAWCLPLVRVGGRVLAFKGASAGDEVTAHAAAVRRLGGATPVVRRCGVDLLESPTTVVEIVRERPSRR
jgi:16S rRNA (guanine527-N7)-methyltransferase